MKYTKEEIEFLDKCAIAVMNGIFSRSKIDDFSRNYEDFESVSIRAYKMSKQMLKARKEVIGE